ncbi:MAG: FkbM family methyltransferase [Solirubrobacteraceae bacterium]
MTEVIRLLRGHHEPQEELAFHNLVGRLEADTVEPTMVELGSFWGYYSMWLKRAIPSTRLILVEPDAAHLAVGSENLALNQMEAVCLHAAIGETHDATVQLTWESDGEAHATRQVSIDGLMDELGLERIDLLLCDVQGAETAALLGASRALAERRVRFLVISTHHHSISGEPLTHQRCMTILRDASAHVIAEHSVAESCSGDGLIVASLDPRDVNMRVEVTIVRPRDSLFGELEWDLAQLAERASALEEWGTACRDAATAKEAELAAAYELIALLRNMKVVRWTAWPRQLVYRARGALSRFRS